MTLRKLAISDQECSALTAGLPGMMLHAVQQTAMIDGVRQMARETWAVKVRSPELATRIVPGQFFMIRPQHGSDPLLGRPFALYDVYTDEYGMPLGVEFGFVRVGKLTSLMSQWTVGEHVQIWGPLGNGFPVPDCRHLVFAAGGIGQTPFLAVAREALQLNAYGLPSRRFSTSPESVTMCYGVRSAKYLAGLDDFRLPGLDLKIATDDGSSGHHGYVTDLLRDVLDQQKPETHVYCCGPEPMMKAVAEVCEDRRVPCWL